MALFDPESTKTDMTGSLISNETGHTVTGPLDLRVSMSPTAPVGAALFFDGARLKVKIGSSEYTLAG
jgi:hypothetical protein